jgi:hypothetical protein
MEILVLVLESIAILLGFCVSVGVLVLDRERYERVCERWPIISTVPYIGGFMLFIILPTYAGELARKEVKPWPWDEFIIENHRLGFLVAAIGILELTTYYLWSFLIPGHYYASYIAQRAGRRPWYPYQHPGRVATLHAVQPYLHVYRTDAAYRCAWILNKQLQKTLRVASKRPVA